MNNTVTISCSIYSVSTGQSIGDLRLAGSRSDSAGRLEVYYNRRWGTVCDDNFGPNDARVACAQLRYSDYTQYGRVGTLG